MTNKPLITESVPKLRPPTASLPGRVDITHIMGQSYAVFIRGHELTVDQPLEAGGDDDGPTPVELFVASLASCVAYYAGRFLQRHHLPYENLRVHADFDMAHDRPPRVAAVRLTVRPPVGLNTARRAALRAVVGKCTVTNTLHAVPDIAVTVD